MTKFDNELWALVASERMRLIGERADERARVQRLRAYSNDLLARAEDAGVLRVVGFREAAADHLKPGDMSEEFSECQ